MKPGTPGFVGERLRTAREARGLSAASFASVIGVSRAAVTQYEKGRQTPSPDVMRAITERLNLPLHHFLRDLPVSEGEEVVFYRSLSSTTKAARTKAQQRYAWFRDIVAHLRRYVKFPSVNVPEFDLPNDKPAEIRQEDIEESATQTRRFWGIGDNPIGNTALLLEKNGVIVGCHDLDSDKLDAFSEWNQVDGAPYVILNSEKGTAVRHRFDVGHELAHLTLHRNVGRPTLNTRSMFSLMEDQANRFSGAFLLPEHEFAKDLHTVSLDLLRALKAKWRVSIGAMIKRAAHLGFLSETQERRLWINYSRRGWRKHEPLDDQLENEGPRYLRRCIELLVQKNVVQCEDLSFQLALPPSDIEQLVGLPSGFFESDEPEIEFKKESVRRILPFPR